jgi:hypothetical protein
VVSADAALIRGSGVVSVQRWPNPTTLEQYAVDFNRPVDTCAIVASTGGNTSDYEPLNTNTLVGGAGGNTVFVETADDGDVTHDTDFTLAVLC